MKLTIITILALLAAAPVWAHKVDLLLLRTVICDYETRGLGVYRDTAHIGDHGEVGRCQVRASTARTLGHDGQDAMLIFPLINLYWASKVLDDCYRVGRRGAYEIAYCYIGGPGSRPYVNGPTSKLRRYAKIIAVEYAEKVRQRQWD